MANNKQNNKASKPSIKFFKLSELIPAKYNHREISPEALAALSESIKRFGVVEPIVVNTRSGRPVIIGGHQRAKALLRLYGPEYKCVCMAHSLDSAGERALNITLNNQALRAEYTSAIDAEVERLRADMKNDELFYKLRIDQLRQEINEKSEGQTTYKIETVKPYKQVHVLLSFPPEVFGEVSEHLQKIIKVEGVEYEQAAN